jgi:hypothetical protein
MIGFWCGVLLEKALAELPLVISHGDRLSRALAVRECLRPAEVDASDLAKLEVPLQL